jgi:hypothetical protein
VFAADFHCAEIFQEMAIHRERAQVYSVVGTRMRSVGVCEAYAMVRNGQARLISSSRATQCVIQLTVTLAAAGQGSQISISYAEMQAIAGLCGRALPHRTRIKRHPDGTEERIEIPENFAFKAQKKFSWWPAIGDTLAVRVGPRVKRLSN